MKLFELQKSTDNALCVKCGGHYSIPKIAIKHTSTIECPNCGHHNNIGKSMKAHGTVRG